MSEVSGRLWAVGEAMSRSIRSVPELAGGAKVVEVFGSNTFDVSAMKEKLPKPVFKSLQETIRRGTRLDPAIANEVAQAIKEWAIGGRDPLHPLVPAADRADRREARRLPDLRRRRPADGAFSGAQLIQSEPDASSFPSRRPARDVGSARLHGVESGEPGVHRRSGRTASTLCIPSVFIGYNGEALDEMTPLLRSSMDVLSTKAIELLELLGDKGVQRVVHHAGRRAGVLPHRPRASSRCAPTS